MLRCLMLLVLLLLPGSSHAQEEAPQQESSTFEQLDALFGDVVVNPLASVMFWDIAFWDNTLPMGQGVGTEVDGKEVVGFEDGQYVLRTAESVPVTEVKVGLTKPRRFEVGQLTVQASDRDGTLVGMVMPGTLELAPCTDAETCGVVATEWEGREETDETVTFKGEGGDYVVAAPLPDGPTLRVLEDRAPFPVLVTFRDDGRITVFPGEVELSPELLPPEVGDTVTLLDQRQGTVLSITEDTVEVEIGEGERIDGPLANPNDIVLPLVVVWLVFGAVFFTLRMQFINLRGFVHAVQVTAGKFDHEGDTGEISHFQALSSALSATVGLGNIAGVAIAVGVGGPGAIFWMVFAGFLGMSSKFTECTLGQMYRRVDEHGRISGGPMRYLHLGLEEMGMGGLGRVLAVIFALMCIGGSLGGGNMFQANQSFAALAAAVPAAAQYDWIYGIVLALLVASVILGGIKRIGAAAGLIVPLMCGVYVMASLFILVTNADQVAPAFAKIISEAFTPEAGRGGFIGVLVQGFRRAAFSNEAGIGSASIAHSAAATEEPVREGIVALLEPFIDTIIVCTVTGLVVVITGTYLTNAGDGVVMTSAAFETVIPWFPKVLSLAVIMFAFSTMISWSYYGERCAEYLFGPAASTPYKIIFLFFVFFGAVFELGNVLTFSDLMVLGMAFPNIAGLLILSGKVRGRLDDYWGRLKSGEMQPVK